MQVDTISKLEKVYSSLVKSHQNLWIEHEKLVTGEKKRDKFFIKKWKGVMGLWKVLKPLDRLPSSQVEIDDEATVEWTDLKENGDDVEFESESSP